MKLNRYQILFFTLITVLISSCDRELETEGLTKKITYYPVIEMDGEETYVVHFGEDFSLPGVTATEQGKEIPVTETVSGTYFHPSVEALDTSVPDVYTVTYSATNVDGYSGSVSRTVVVLPPTGNLVTSLEGVYTVSVVRTPAGGPADADYTDREYAYITKIAPNTYQISDAIGGYYEFGRSYGPTYAATGATVLANNIPGNNFTFTPAVVGSFGGNATITTMDVDPAAKTINFTSTWPTGPYTFKVTLKQVQL